MPASAKGCHVRFEPAKESDDEELRALLHKTPMGGSISVEGLRNSSSTTVKTSSNTEQHALTPSADLTRITGLPRPWREPIK